MICLRLYTLRVQGLFVEVGIIVFTEIFTLPDSIERAIVTSVDSTLSHNIRITIHMKYIIGFLHVLTVGLSCAAGDLALDKKGCQLGVCDWSIGKKQTPEAFDFAKKLGFDGVQVSFNGGDPSLFWN